MKVKDLLGRYERDPLLLSAVIKLKDNAPSNIHIKGLVGSMEPIAIAAMWHQAQNTFLVVANDKDQASLLHSDIKSILESDKPLLFPASYKKPYQYVETENANILQRAEVLSTVNTSPNIPHLIVTYPEALAEKVINRISLAENTFSCRVGEAVSQAFVVELLESYEFERTDYVYEPGQFALRGSIIDVFSYSGDYPVRIEFFDSIVESIRTFDPESQISVSKIQVFSFVPNVQTKLLQVVRESMLEFLPKDTIIIAKDFFNTFEIVDRAYEKAEQSFSEIVKVGGESVVMKPEQLFDNAAELKKQLKKHSVVETGKKSHFKNAELIQYITNEQPPFNKDFKKLVEKVGTLQHSQYDVLISSDSPKQLERLQIIFDEEDKQIKFLPLYAALSEGFEDTINGIAVYTDHQIFNRYFKHKTKERFNKNKGITLKELKTLQPGDFVTHIDYGVGRFAGLETIENSGKRQEGVRLVFRDDDYLIISIHSLHKISKYSGKDGLPPGLSKLGSDEWDRKKTKVKKKVRDIARELINLYAKRKAAPGFAFTEDSVWQAELETSFLYEDTPDQMKATADFKKDMESVHPMDRLVCGDVGFGKTEIAIRAAFKAVYDKKQVAVLVPTTILAMQHFKTFSDRLRNFPCNIDYINRFKSATEIKDTLNRLADGKIDILIGTHKLTGNEVKFRDLGLLVIDEEQKFGVATKEKLKKLKVNVDTLTLSATPIPRTLQFSLMGARDLSIIATPPPNRQPVTTELCVYSEEIFRDAISTEIKRGGQVFVVHNRVSDIEEVANTVLRMVPDARVAVAHGQMDGTRLENTMLKFMEGEYDVLVSTNIIESGLDISNANTIIINRANYFGLSDLHQMRGRVGRSNRKAYCYLIIPGPNALTPEARKRLQALEEFSDLGDGFKVAMRDMDIRGAGDLLGAEQSGFISDVGFDAYHKILDETIQELKETEFRDLFEGQMQARAYVTDCVIETDLEIIIPEDYIKNISERLNIYTRMDNVKTEDELYRFGNELADRFGPLPPQVQDLLYSVRLRWLAEKAGMEKVSIKDNLMKGYFIGQERQDYYQSELFGNVLKYVQGNSAKTRLKEVGKKLILQVQDVKDIEAAMTVLKKILNEAEPVLA